MDVDEQESTLTEMKTAENDVNDDTNAVVDNNCEIQGPSLSQEIDPEASNASMGSSTNNSGN